MFSSGTTSSEDDLASVAAAAGFHAVAAAISADQVRSADSVSSEPPKRKILPVSRRVGRGTRVKTFVWQPERSGPPPKAKDPVEFREIARLVSCSAEI
jgi:hypothetical protein